MATRSVDKWRAWVAARHVLEAADSALYVCPGEDTAAICRLAWKAVDLASEATGALPPCTRDLLVCVVRTTFAAEQLLRWNACCRRQRFIASLRSLGEERRRRLERRTQIATALRALVDVFLGGL